MKFKVFEDIITEIKEQSEKTHTIYELGIDLIEFTDGYSKIWSLLLKAYYGKAGEDWITWFIFERDDRPEAPNQACDTNGNPICYDIKSLWEHVEEIRSSIDFVEYE